MGTGTGNEVLKSGNGTGNRYCADHRRARAEELLSDNDEVLSSSDDDEVLSSYFRDRAAVKLVPGDHGDDARVLLPDSGHCSGVTDIESDCRDLGGNPPMFPEGLNLPDGAGMSRPPPPAVEEEEEEVVFRNLPPLVCTMHAENQKILVELADTSDSVLKEVVKLIHSYLSAFTHTNTLSLANGCTFITPLLLPSLSPFSPPPPPPPSSVMFHRPACRVLWMGHLYTYNLSTTGSLIQL